VPLLVLELYLDVKRAALRPQQALERTKAADGAWVEVFCLRLRHQVVNYSPVDFRHCWNGPRNSRIIVVVILWLNTADEALRSFRASS
jgi:hypothetical protein